MHDGTNIIEVAATTSGELPEDYRLARELTLAGSDDEAQRIYWQILADTQSPTTRAVVYNDLAVLAAAAGDAREARALLEEALTIDPQCRAVRENWIALVPTGEQPHFAPQTPQNEPVPDRQVKVAIVSGMFNWPSSGGGSVHTLQLARALQDGGCQVQHYYLRYEPWSIGVVEENPIQSQPICFSNSEWSLTQVQSRVAAAVRECAPDIVLVTDCWSLKPWLAEAVSGFPYLLRFDAMECLCPLNNLRVIPHPNQYLEPCTKHRLATPEHCRKCVQEHSRFVSPLHKSERDFSRFETKEYHDLLLRTLASAEAVLVHNPLIAAALEPYARKVQVVPIGVDPQTFGAIPSLEAKYSFKTASGGGQAHICSATVAVDPETRVPVPSAKMSQSSDRVADGFGIKRVLFGGRTRDVAKGFQVLSAAGEKLWRDRQDFRIVATGDPRESDQPFVVWRGWQSHNKMPTILAEADIVAAPAVAHEPFGLTVVEAMAAARPLVASRVGGQQFTVVDGVNGLLCEPDDPVDLAEKLSTLLDSAALRIEMGNAGRRRFLAEYSWDVVIDRYYRPLLGRRAHNRKQSSHRGHREHGDER